MLRPSVLPALLLALTGGCGARTPLHLGSCFCAPGQECCPDGTCVPTGSECTNSDGGSPPSDAGIESDAVIGPDATVTPGLQLSIPTIVFDGAQEGLGLQRFGQLVWTGDRFGVVWIENDSGHLFVNLRFIGESGDVLPGKHRISDDYIGMEDSPQSTWLTWNGSELGVFWTVEQRIVMRRVGLDGQPLASPVVAVSGIGTNAYIDGAIALPDGYGLVWRDDSHQTYAYLPYFVRISSEGEQQSLQVRLVEGFERVDTVGGVVRQAGTYTMVWNVREAGGEDSVYATRFDDFGNSLGAPIPLYAAENAMLSYFGPALAGGSRATAALWDMDRGVVLVDVEDGLPMEQSLVEPDVTGHANLAGSTDGTMGLIFGQGEWESTNPLPTDLMLLTTNSAHQIIDSPMLVNRPPAGQDSCLESYTIAAADDGFGLLWAEGCTAARTVYFSRAR